MLLSTFPLDCNSACQYKRSSNLSGCVLRLRPSETFYRRTHMPTKDKTQVHEANSTVLTLR